MKNIFGFFFICLIFTTFTYVDNFFLKSDIFFLDEISLEGDIGTVSKELEGEVALLKGRLIWDIDTDKLEEILEEDVRVEEATVRKQIPNKVTIRIKGKKPHFYILYSGKIYSLDEEKKVFSYLEEFPMKDYPILSIKDMEEIEELTEILERIKGKQLESLVSQLYVEDENCIKMVLLDGTVIKTKQEVSEEKYSLLERLYLKLKSGGDPLEYIDIRFRDYIVK